MIGTILRYIAYIYAFCMLNSEAGHWTFALLLVLVIQGEIQSIMLLKLWKERRAAFVSAFTPRRRTGKGDES